MRIQLRNRLFVATPTPLASRKAASGRTVLRGLPGWPESLARGMFSERLARNQRELPIPSHTRRKASGLGREVRATKG